MLKKTKLACRNSGKKLFNISEKLRLLDILVVDMDSGKRSYQIKTPEKGYAFRDKNYYPEHQSKKESKPVAEWIIQNPVLIFKFVYKDGSLQLTSDAHTLLMQILKIKHVGLYEHIQARKQMYYNRNEVKGKKKKWLPEKSEPVDKSKILKGTK